jgi:hypothetical protein
MQQRHYPIRQTQGLDREGTQGKQRRTGRDEHGLCLERGQALELDFPEGHARLAEIA